MSNLTDHRFMCPEALELAQVLDEMLAPALGEKAPLGLVQQTLLMVQDKAMLYLRGLDGQHQMLEGGPAHWCVTNVHGEAYDRLSVVLRRLVPPMPLLRDYFTPPTRQEVRESRNPTQAIYGLALGESEFDE